MLANKHTRNVRSLSAPSDHKARGVLTQDTLARTSLWSTMMKQYPSVNGHRDLKQADGNNCGRLALDYPADEGWRWQEDIRVWADRHHVLSPMGFKRQSKFSFSSLSQFSSRNNTEFFPLLIKQNPLNPPQQDSPVPNFPREQTPRQPTPSPSGTRWSEGLFRATFPGPSPSSQPPGDNMTREPEPEVAPTQSTEEPF
ncbi:hypothetical protein O181_127653, partial [Austropuccinia psidii MF-1]|nr:hypothetical protein [Austropuccinia psidii MF-1]